MTTDAKRDALLDFLDERVFIPAIDADPASYSDMGDRKLLASVKKRVERTRVRYQHHYATPAEVRANFLKDLDSTFGQDLATDMWSLKLRRFEDIKPPFLNLCAELGV
jgi:hypothetical protein